KGAMAGTVDVSSLPFTSAFIVYFLIQRSEEFTTLIASFYSIVSTSIKRSGTVVSRVVNCTVALGSNNLALTLGKRPTFKTNILFPFFNLRGMMFQPKS